MLIGDLLRLTAERYPHKTAIIYANNLLEPDNQRERTIDYAELDRRANAFANAVLDLGLKRGANLGLMMSNRPEFAIAYFGAARSGTVVVCLSTRLTADELTVTIEKGEVAALVLEETFLPLVLEARRRCGRPRHLIIVPDAHPSELPAGAAHFAEFAASASALPPAVQISENDPFCINYTGATTGFPKAVLVTHRARIATAIAAAIEFNFDDRDILGVSTPLFHTAGLYIWFVPGVMLGCTMVLMSGWNAAGFIETIARERISAVFLVPTQLSDIITSPAFSREKLSTLKTVNYGGAPMPLSLLDRVEAAMPGTAFIDNYGQSETGPITVRKPWHPREKRSSVGRPIFNMQVRILDDQLRPLPAGETGEIAVRGDQMFSGYYNDPELTRETTRAGDGWVMTGDIGRFDQEGFITLISRSKDMIIAGGENIYSREIENALYRHQAVLECAVFGIPDERLGEVPAAHIVLRPGAAVSEDEMLGFCAERVARHKRPRLVRFVESLPKTTAGKIQKFVIRAPYWPGASR
ncbi:MAG: class I adenylate-forming enzyme family protein [Candidatus Binataceae bacterium]